MMRSLHMTRMLTVAAVLAVSCAAAQAEQLLSRNATYRVYGAGYCYTGGVQPGVNLRVKKGVHVFTPLVEQTDTGDLLIDGDTDGKSTVYTPWFWTAQWKIIIVEMSLPGPSKVSRVDVYLPEAVAWRPESTNLYVKTGAGTWGKIGSMPSESGPPGARVHKRKLTFTLQNVACQELKLVFTDDGAQHGVAEIEVWGEGPSELQISAEFGGKYPIQGTPQVRGLIRSQPHIETFAAPKPQLPDGSVLLTKTGKTTVTLSGDTLTAGTGEMLVDQDRSTVLRVDKRPHSHFSLTAELDLGAVYLIDAVHVWMPGGKGSATGHVHDLTLAIGSAPAPGAGAGAGSVWQTPVDLMVNPYWPGDDAPQPYVIPISNLKVVGQRVRITATLMGTGGVTNRLALAEVEVWGRPAGQAAGQVVGLDKRPIEFERRPVGTLHPKWRWLKERKVRAAWIGDNLAAKFPGTDKTKGDVLVEAGFNLVRVSGWVDRKNRDVNPFFEKHLPLDVKEARRVGIALLVGWQYGSAHLEPYRKYRAPSGYLNERSCCPLDYDYIERQISQPAVAIARSGADGMVIDTEMYESDQTNYPGACICDDCFTTYLKTFAQGWQIIDEQVPAERRGLWLTANGASGHYGSYQSQRIIALYDSIRQRCQAINPAFIFGHAPGMRHMSVIMRGLGTPSLPCLALAELEYYSGPTGRSKAAAELIPKNGMPVLYLPGLWCSQQMPEQLADNALRSALDYDGWWLYYAEGILTHPAADDPKAFHSHGRVKGTSARQYLDKITATHQRLDEYLDMPRERWPRSDVAPAPPQGR